MSRLDHRSHSTNPPAHALEELAVSGMGSSPRILIIGAGMSGILLVIRLREAGFHHVTVFEKSDRPGGTWRDNTYPGLKCDVPAHMFTYSFEPNPEYSHRFPTGPEIRDYLMRVYHKYDVGRSVQFQKSVESCVWEDGKWFVQTSDGFVESFDVVLSATGILHTPRFPDIAGAKDFEGDSFHTARWDHSIPLQGKRVGVIGTGSTSAQIIPELVGGGSHVTLFQRTPQWIFPMPNKTYCESDKARLRKSPTLGKVLRNRYSKIFQWTFARAVIGNPLLLWCIESFCKSHLKRKVKDPILREKLTPRDRAGCKRLIFAKGFYTALQHPHASLVTEKIDRIDAEGIRTSDGQQHALDVLIYATGFQAHNYMRPIVVQGREGKTIDEVWESGAKAHRSTSIPGFPNFFMLFGPYSPIGNYSAISVAEAQCGYIVQQLQHLKTSQATTIEPRQDATDALHEKMQRALKKTVWLSGCASWYMDEKGNVPMWPWTFERYEREMSRLNPKEFVVSTDAPRKEKVSVANHTSTRPLVEIPG